MDLAKVDQIVDNWSGRKDCLVEVLHDAQSAFNWLPQQVIERVSEKMEVPAADIYRVASFYHSFSLKPRGKHLCGVCMGTACHVKGAPGVYDAIKRELSIDEKQDTDKDRNFTVQVRRCLGACGLAPVIVIDDDMQGELDQVKVKRLIKRYIKADSKNG